jgi:hypothetical protein
MDQSVCFANTHFASMKLWVQTPILPKTKNKSKIKQQCQTLNVNGITLHSNWLNGLKNKIQLFKVYKNSLHWQRHTDSKAKAGKNVPASLNSSRIALHILIDFNIRNLMEHGLEAQLKWESASLASTRPWVQTPELSKENNKIMWNKEGHYAINKENNPWRR